MLKQRLQLARTTSQERQLLQMLDDGTAATHVISVAGDRIGRSHTKVVQVELMRVDIETVSELSAGQTVCDIWHQSSKPKNVGVAQVQKPAKHYHLFTFVSSAY